jgi:hypothetical protein
VNSRDGIVKPREWQHIAVVVINKQVFNGQVMIPKTVKFYVNGNLAGRWKLKPVVKAPGFSAQRLKPKYDHLLENNIR